MSEKKSHQWHINEIMHNWYDFKFTIEPLHDLFLLQNWWKIFLNINLDRKRRVKIFLRLFCRVLALANCKQNVLIYKSQTRKMRLTVKLVEWWFFRLVDSSHTIIKLWFLMKKIPASKRKRFMIFVCCEFPIVMMLAPQAEMSTYKVKIFMMLNFN